MNPYEHSFETLAQVARDANDQVEHLIGEAEKWRSRFYILLIISANALIFVACFILKVIA